jgi:hypothetical protein
MYCKYCGKKISDDSKFCKYCGHKVKEKEDPNGLEKKEDMQVQYNKNNKETILSEKAEFEKYEPTESESDQENQSAIIKYFKVIFNIFFYTVTAFFGLYLLMGSSVPAVLIGHLFNILLSPFTWAFYILIFIFKKNPKKSTGIISIVFGSFNIFYVFVQVFILGI